MSARNTLMMRLAMVAGSYSPQRDRELIDAFAHELAERQRGLTRKACVNDRDGDGDCAACARNPEASCRQYSREDQAIRMAADEIDPAKESSRG